ncbi:MAG: hypothetical protein GEU99_24610 [Luteitalea sp.]|nr:hypothetical protein [Luteitalea sp.]
MTWRRVCLVGIAGLTMTVASAVGQPDGTHRLPWGPGLAAWYAGDAGIENDPSVVFADNFESGGIDDLESRWGYMSNSQGSVMSFSDDVPEGSAGSRSLQMTATRGENSGGELYKTFDPGWDKIYLRFYTKFAEDHGNHHHFVALRGFDDPLPYPTGGAGQLAEDYFSVTIEPTTVEKNAYPTTTYPPPSIWQFYAYWPEMRSWQTVEGEPDGRPDPYFGNQLFPREAAVVPRDAWVAVEFMLKMNSWPRAHNGELAMWINGEPLVSFAPGTPHGYWIRDHFRNDPYHPDARPFRGFRWRTDMNVMINVLRLQHYVSSSAFNSTQNYADNNPDYLINTEEATVWFDNVVMATEYIGPMAGTY